MKGEQIRLNMMHTRLAPPSPWRTSPASPSSLSAPVRPTPTSRVWMQRLISSELLRSWTPISWLLWPNRKLTFCRRWWQHWWNRSSEIGTILACSQYVFKQKFLIYHLLSFFVPTKSTTSPSFSSSSCGKAFIGKIPEICCRNIFIAGSKRHFAHVVIFIPGLCSWY